MSLYLYLNEHWHADTWVGGGMIPISPASTYKSLDRSGIYTPDENLIHKSDVDLKSFGRAIHIDPGADIRELTMRGARIGGVLIPDIIDADYYEDDGLILSFCRRFKKPIARRMKKKACVKILDIGRLKSEIDEQLGAISLAAYCQYTHDHQRNHFLKSNLDRWQEEFRLFWPITEKVDVQISAGTAELMRKW
jgi:hypothetical protein